MVSLLEVVCRGEIEGVDCLNNATAAAVKDVIQRGQEVVDNYCAQGIEKGKHSERQARRAGRQMQSECKQRQIDGTPPFKRLLAVWRKQDVCQARAKSTIQTRSFTCCGY
eukprot:2727084-Amphidinium_carterae.1